MDERKIDVIIALLGKLVAASAPGDDVLALAGAGLRPAEIAQILNMKENTVSKRLERDRKKERR